MDFKTNSGRYSIIGMEMCNDGFLDVLIQNGLESEAKSIVNSNLHDAQGNSISIGSKVRYIGLEDDALSKGDILTIDDIALDNIGCFTTIESGRYFCGAEVVKLDPMKNSIILNTNNTFVNGLLQKSKEDLAMLVVQRTKDYKLEKAECEWLDHLADCLRDGGSSEEQTSLHEEYEEEVERIKKVYENQIIRLI